MSGVKAGFTLAELLVSFAILALVVGVSAAFLRVSGPSIILRSASREIASDLRHASELASATQIAHVVRFDIVGARYTIARQSTPEVTVKESILPSSLTFSSITIPNASAEFNTLGATTTPGLITLQHQNGTTTTIDLRPSGYVRIE